MAKYIIDNTEECGNDQEKCCKSLWDKFAVDKFDKIAPEGVNYFEYYHGRQIHVIDSEETKRILPNAQNVKALNGTYGFLDFDGTYFDMRTGKSVLIGLNAKFYQRDYVLLNDVLYRLTEELELVEVMNNVKFVCEHDLERELYIMTHTGTYIFNPEIKQSRHYQGLSGQMTIEYGDNNLHKLTIVIGDIDYSSQLKYVKFVYGAHAKASLGLVCLDTWSAVLFR